MLGLSRGELMVVAVITAFVVTATWWPRLGAWLAERLARGRR